MIHVLENNVTGIPYSTVLVRTKCGFSRESPKKMKEIKKAN